MPAALPAGRAAGARAGARQSLPAPLLGCLPGTPSMLLLHLHCPVCTPCSTPALLAVAASRRACPAAAGRPSPPAAARCGGLPAAAPGRHPPRIAAGRSRRLLSTRHARVAGAPGSCSACRWRLHGAGRLGRQAEGVRGWLGQAWMQWPLQDAHLAPISAQHQWGSSCLDLWLLLLHQPGAWVLPAAAPTHTIDALKAGQRFLGRFLRPPTHSLPTTPGVSYNTT